MNMKYSLLLLVVILLSGCSPSLQSVPAAKFEEAVQGGAVLIDIRTSQEYDASHIEGARNIDYYAPNFQAQLDQLDRDQSYAIYCRSGSRSSSALRLMEEMGFTDVVELQGGILSLE